jgi:hypothetical protein
MTRHISVDGLVETEGTGRSGQVLGFQNFIDAMSMSFIGNEMPHL